MLFRSDASSKSEEKGKSKNKKQEAREEKKAKDARRQLAQGARARSQNKKVGNRKSRPETQREEQEGSSQGASLELVSCPFTIVLRRSSLWPCYRSTAKLRFHTLGEGMPYVQ
jgi:hypothetical protein